jgi:hypothetical protein
MGHAPGIELLLRYRVLSVRQYAYASIAALLSLTTPTNSSAGVDVPLMWSVSDDDLSKPVGAVVDVSVGRDGTVYLLDTQNWSVFRINVEGEELSGLGRRGEGPGEFSHPLFVAARASGGCVVVQDFYSPAVCLDATGAVCEVPDVSAIRDRFAITQFFGARLDRVGRLLLTAMTTTQMPDARSSRTTTEIGWSIFRITQRNSFAEVLFSNREELCEESTIELTRYAPSYTDRAWDLNEDGQLLFANPMGGYTVTIGHPVDGASQTIHLKPYQSDEKLLRKLAKDTGKHVEDIPRIAALYWIGNDHFIVKPMATVERKTISRGGLFELFDRRGRSYGRAPLSCDYNPEQDGFFIQNGILVIVEGGKAANDAAIRQKALLIGENPPPSPSSDPPDFIRVCAYDLVAHYTGLLRFKKPSRQ